MRAKIPQQSAIAELGKQALRETGLQSFLDAAVRLLAETLGVEFCKVLELTPDKKHLLLKAGVGWKEGYVGQATVGTQRESQAGYTLQQESPVVVEDLRDEERFTAPPLLVEHDVSSGLSVVIRGDRGYFGVLGAHSTKPRKFSKHDIDFFDYVGYLLGLIFQRDRNITERRQAGEALKRSERLRAVGELSAGISHNLNDLLTGILGPAQLLRSTTDDPEVVGRLDEILAAGWRARELVRRLGLSLRGPRQGGPLGVEVKEVISEAIQLVWPSWKDEAKRPRASIEIVTEFQDVGAIRGTRSDFQDVMVNLLSNSVDAMPEGGVITIAAEAIGELVQITVKDTGVGMDEDLRRRIFEPLFTTKAGIGNGLGLAMVHGTIAGWGGSIDVESAVGQGSTFTLRLPRGKSSETETEVALEEISSRRARILIVEDEDVVQQLLRHYLARKHDIEMVADGQEAVEKFVAGRYDLALIDLGLPRLPGDQVARQIKESDPHAIIVLMSGWRLEKTDPRFSAFDLRVEKPIDLKLLDVVIGQAVALHEGRTGLV